MVNIGHNRGKRRIWLEGSRLAADGFTHGARYSRTVEDNSITLYLDPTGKYRVAGTPSRPIVDICGDWVTRWAGADDSVNVLYGLYPNNKLCIVRP